MPGLVHSLPSAHNLDDVGAVVSAGYRDLGGRLQLNVLQLLPFPSDDEAMVLLGDLKLDVCLGGEGNGTKEWVESRERGPKRVRGVSGSRLKKGTLEQNRTKMAPIRAGNSCR